jgi:hypothetical protein
MAKQVTQHVTDDLDGTPGATAIEFSLDGGRWVIDLAPKNQARLRGLLKPYIQAGRTVARAPSGNGSARRDGNRERNRAVREWALANGVELPARGRIAQGYLDAYDVGDVAALYQTAGLEPPRSDKPRRRHKTDA